MKVSQQKTSTNLDKGSVLREIRKRLGFTLEKMSAALDLHWTYLSQLENGKRNVDEWYIEKAERVAQELEKSKEVKGSTGITATIEQKCQGHLAQFLATCDGIESRLHWTLVELQDHLPLNKWSKGDHRELTDAELSEALTAGGAQIVEQDAAAALGLSPKVVSRGGKAAAPAPPSPPGSGGRKIPAKTVLVSPGK